MATFGKKNLNARASFVHRQPAMAAAKSATTGSGSLSTEAEEFLNTLRAERAPAPTYDTKDYMRASSPFASSDGEKPMSGMRIISFLVDMVITILATIPIMVMLIGMDQRGQITEDQAILYIALSFFSIRMLYYIVMEASALQATMGKLLIGGVVTDLRGNKPGIGRIILRNTIGRLISENLPFYVGLMMGFWTQKKQTLHDMISGTHVRKKSAQTVYGSTADVFA